MLLDNTATAESTMLMDSLSALSALLFVLAVLGLLAWAAKRFGMVPGQPRVRLGQKKITIVESRILDSRNRLVMVEWNGKEYLLATNPAGVTPISEQTPDFQKMLDEHETK
ncbi:MAG: FliO/MopB family protein [Kordiimonadaceae bacterium]|nr:FliO/MopB family protein [Kordiimonadaceae bacterium]